MAERIPPHSEEAERSVIGACMLDEQALLDVLEIVNANDFYNKAHKEIMDCIISMQQSNKAVDLLTVCDELESRKALAMVGGRGYIATLTNDVPSVANAAEYAKIVSEKATMRSLISAAEEMSANAYNGRMDAVEALNSAEESIFSIGQKKQQGDYTHIKDVLPENLKAIDAAVKNGGPIMGVPTGFSALDKVIHGYQKQTLNIIAARPGVGKTAFALNIAAHAAINAKKSVLFFSIEMSKEELGARLISIRAKVESEKLKTGNLDDDDWQNVAVAVEALSSSNLFIDDNSGSSLIEIRNKCRRLKSTPQGLDLIIIDYLQLMAGELENRNVEIGNITRSLKLLSKEMNCPVVLLSQLNRASETATDKHPTIAHLRDSGNIEQDADTIILLYRDELVHKDTQKLGVCEVNLAKHRQGNTKEFELAWVGRYTAFNDIEY